MEHKDKGITMNQTIVHKSENPGCLIQLLWFAIIGWWATEVWLAAAWFLMVTIIGIPLAVAMINKIPLVLALRGQSTDLSITYEDGKAVIDTDYTPAQHNIILRAVYFILIGWWLCALWMQVSYFFCMSIIGLPVGFWMFDKTAGILTLKR